MTIIKSAIEAFRALSREQLLKRPSSRLFPSNQSDSGITNVTGHSTMKTVSETLPLYPSEKDIDCVIPRSSKIGEHPMTIAEFKAINRLHISTSVRAPEHLMRADSYTIKAYDRGPYGPPSTYFRSPGPVVIKRLCVGRPYNEGESSREVGLTQYLTANAPQFSPYLDYIATESSGGYMISNKVSVLAEVLKERESSYEGTGAAMPQEESLKWLKVMTESAIAMYRLGLHPIDCKAGNVAETGHIDHGNTLLTVIDPQLPRDWVSVANSKNEHYLDCYPPSYYFGRRRSFSLQQLTAYQIGSVGFHAITGIKLHEEIDRIMLDRTLERLPPEAPLSHIDFIRSNVPKRLADDWKHVEILRPLLKENPVLRPRLTSFLETIKEL